MPKYVRVGDKYVSFPDDMSQEDIQQVLTSQFSEEKTGTAQVKTEPTTQVETEPTRELSIGEQIGAGIDDTTAMWGNIWEETKKAPSILAHLPGAIYDQVTGASATEETERGMDAFFMPTSKAQLMGYNVFEPNLNAGELVSGAMTDVLIDIVNTNASPDEMADIYVSNVEGVTKRKDDKGNVFLKHPAYKQEFPIKPGARFTDVPGFLLDALGSLGVLKIMKPIARKYLKQSGKKAFQSAFKKKLQDATEAGVVDFGYEAGRQLGQAGFGGTADALDPLLTGVMSFGAGIGPKLVDPVQSTDVAELMQPIAKGSRADVPMTQLIEEVGVDPSLVKAETATGFDLPAAAIATTQKGKEALRTAEQLSPETYTQERLARNIEIAEKGLEDAGAVYKVDAPDVPGVSEMAKESLGDRRDKLKSIADKKFAQVDKYISKDDDVYMKNTMDFIKSTKEGAGTRYTSVIKQIDEAIQRGGYNYNDLINQKSVVGQNMKMKSEAYRNMKDADITALYNAITKDQADNIIDIAKRQPGMNEKEAMKISRINEQAKKATSKYIEAQKNIDEYFEGAKNITAKVSGLLNTAKKAPGEKLGELINMLPKSNRSQVMMTAFADSVTGKGGVDFDKFFEVYNSIANNPKMLTEFNKNIGPSAKKFFRNMYSLSKAMHDEARSAKLTETQRKSLIDAMSPKSFIEASINTVFTKIGYSKIIDTLFPGAGFAAVGLTSDIVSKGQAKRLESLGKFISSPEFKGLMRGYATNKLNPNQINKFANSKALNEFWKDTKQTGGQVAKRAFVRSITPYRQEEDAE